jgi:aerobic-type carbon monoxide dehydrogenase small subunit (CoxS/CutS family)
MSQDEKEVKSNEISRREFLKDAGLIVGGATVGSMALMNACNSTTTVTAPGATSTKTVTATTTVGGTGSTVTTTVTAPGGTTTVTATGTGAASFTDPVDGTTWPSLDALKAHFNTVHPNADANIVGLNVNGTEYAVLAKPYWSLAHVLRESLGLFALKEGCNLGECGACTVVADGKAVFSCMILAVEAENMKVTTVEGLSNNGKLNALQQKWYDNEVWQCGFCTPGFLMAATALLAANAKPTIADVRMAFSGHLCMCGNLHRHINGTVGGV